MAITEPKPNPQIWVSPYLRMLGKIFLATALSTSCTWKCSMKSNFVVLVFWICCINSGTHSSCVKASLLIFPSSIRAYFKSYKSIRDCPVNQEKSNAGRTYSFRGTEREWVAPFFSQSLFARTVLTQGTPIEVLFNVLRRQINLNKVVSFEPQGPSFFFSSSAEIHIPLVCSGLFRQDVRYA